jgi:hypothetical protein
MGLEITDGVGVVIGKFLDFINAPLGEVDFPGIAGIHIAVCNAENFLCVIQLSLVGPANDQNHKYLLNECVDRYGAQFAYGQRVAGNITVHTREGSICPTQGKTVANQTSHK